MAVAAEVEAVRIVGALFLVILLAMAAALFLRSESTTSTLEAVTSIATDLREEGVEGQAFKRRTAERMVAAMAALIATPEDIGSHTDELRTIGATAASWADVAPSPSVALTVSVALRSAASELRAHALRPSASRLQAAGRYLDTARAALAGEPRRNDPTDAIRNRINNLERAQQERQLELEEELGE